jgi:hypothetical protein
VLCRFAAAIFNDTTSKDGRALAHEIAFCVGARLPCEICDAAGLKTDIEWHCRTTSLAKKK